jgi:type VI secretion system secreted protein Hcp
MTDALIYKIPNVEGECKITGYDKLITILSFSHNMYQSVSVDPSNQKRTSGRVNVGEFQLTKQMDKASVVLVDAINTGKNLGTSEFYILKTASDAAEGQKVFMTYKFDDTMISSYSISGGGGEPIESLTISFTKMYWTYEVQEATGKKGGQVTSNYNLALSKKE